MLFASKYSWLYAVIHNIYSALQVQLSVRKLFHYGHPVVFPVGSPEGCPVESPDGSLCFGSVFQNL